MSKSPVKRAFISSTNIDLLEHRKAVEKVLHSHDFFPEMNEHWPAMSASAVEACIAKVDLSDIYIGIFAHRYGTIPDGSAISITEMEFNRATERKIERLCFLIDDTYTEWP